MDVGGPLATGIFIITALTVVGALLSYIVFKMRETEPEPEPECSRSQ